MAGQRRRTEARGFRKNPKFAGSEADVAHSFSEAERKASRHEEGRPVRWTREFGPDADIPDDPRRQLVAKADLRADDGRLAARDGLLGEDVADDRGAGELRSAHRIAGAERELVTAVALLVAARRQELIAGIEVNAQAFDRFRDNALRLDGEAACVDAGRRIQADLHGKSRKRQGFLVEVVENAEAQIAGLRSVVDPARIGGQRRADSHLKIGKCTVKQLDGKESASRSTALEREAPACLDGDLSSGDRVGIVQSERATFVQILVIDSSGGTSSEPYQHEDRNGDDSSHVSSQP